MSELPKNPDYLKSAKELCSPDPRSHLVGCIERSGFRKTTINDHHSDVAQFEENLAPIWVIAGEKGAYGDGDGDFVWSPRSLVCL